MNTRHSYKLHQYYVTGEAAGGADRGASPTRAPLSWKPCVRVRGILFEYSGQEAEWVRRLFVCDAKHNQSSLSLRVWSMAYAMSESVLMIQEFMMFILNVTRNGTTKQVKALGIILLDILKYSYMHTQYLPLMVN